MANLFPTGYESEIITEGDLLNDQPIGYRNGLSFDYETGDFRRDGKNKILDSDGIESWRSWVINCINTERYKHLAYSTDFGIELDKVFAAESREEAESILTRQCTEAILADPYERTAYIDNIEISWPHPDGIIFACTLHGIQDVTIDITTFLTNSMLLDESSETNIPADIYNETSGALGLGVLGEMVLGRNAIS